MRIALIYSGGTIGCTGMPLAPMRAEAFRALWQAEIAPGLPPDLSTAEIVWDWLDPPLDSSAMGPRDWGVLAARGLVALADGADAVVVLHGTDTMAWSAAALAYLTTLIDASGRPLARLDRPIVLTGSQRPMFRDGALDPASDAAGNVRAALADAMTGTPGVRLVFGGETIPGTRALKISTIEDKAFACPNGAGVHASLPAAPLSELEAAVGRLMPYLGGRAVLPLLASPNDEGTTAAALQALLSAPALDLGALHLLGFGIGNVPGGAGLTPLLREARARGVLLALGSQLPFGPVDAGRYGVGSWLAELGVIPTGDMTAPAAQAKLHMALAQAALHGWSTSVTEAFVSTPVAGEITVETDLSET